LSAIKCLSLDLQNRCVGSETSASGAVRQDVFAFSTAPVSREEKKYIYFLRQYFHLRSLETVFFNQLRERRKDLFEAVFLYSCKMYLHFTLHLCPERRRNISIF
jgi:hypothetical protein